MSAAAINPAPPPANGATPAAGANASGQTGQSAQAQGPLAAFEAMLNTLFGAQAPGADGTAAGATGTGTKTGAKATPGTKTATDDSKTKTVGDGKSATADATATPDASLAALLVPVPPTVPIVAATAAAEGSAVQPGAADKSPGQTAAAVLAALASAADGGKAKAAAPAALSVNGAATNATAIAKVDAALAPKTDAAAAPVPQPAASQAPPATDIPAPTTPALAVATAVVAPPTAAAEAVAPVGAQDPAAKDKVPAPKAAARVDAVKAEAMPGAANALTPKTAGPLQPISGDAAKGDAGGESAQKPTLEAATSASDSPQTPADPTTSSTTTAATLIHAATVAVRGAPQTVANLAAQIVKKLDGRSTQFDIQLDPAGLGKVDVRVAIGADGRMSAAMSFDTPQAAAELRSRAGELQRALEQSGFDLSGGMSFDVASDRGQGGQGGQNQQADAGAAFRGRAFQAALDTTADAAPPPQLTLRRTALAGVDIRI